MRHLSLTIILLATLAGCTANSPHTPAISAESPKLEPAKQVDTPPLVEKTGTVDVYLIPLDDFSVDYAAQMAKVLSSEFGIWVKATIPMGTQSLKPFSGTRQFAAEDIFEQANTVMQRLPEGDKHTFFIFLTNRDINARARNFRFQFSFHDKKCYCSVISAARMHPEPDRSPGSSEHLDSRFMKMTKRAIGEMYFGWTRSSDIKDLMYSPIMSLDDIDHLGKRHPSIPTE